MEKNQTKIILVTPGKTYFGTVKKPNFQVRTSDLLNNPSLFPSHHSQNREENSLTLYKVTELIDGRIPYKTHDQRDIVISKILFFYDEYESLGNATERERTMRILNQQNKLKPEPEKLVNLATSIHGDSFYEITGKFFGRFKQIMKRNFISLTNVKVEKITIDSKKGELSKLPYEIPNSFLAVNTRHIESYIVKSI